MSATLLPSMLVTVSGCAAEVVEPLPWLSFFDSVEAATAAALDGMKILDIGVDERDLEPIREDVQNEALELERLDRRVPLVSGNPLGWELIAYDISAYHSWICYGGLVEDVHAATGIRPQEHGLIASEIDARRAAQWLTESGSEEVPVDLWIPVLLVEVGPTVGDR